MRALPETGARPDDWCELGPADPFIGEGVLVIAGTGDLILWDSRIVHGGVGAGLGSGPPDGAAPDAAPFSAPGLARLSLAVCMTARSRATEERRSLEGERRCARARRTRTGPT